MLSLKKNYTTVYSVSQVEVVQWIREIKIESLGNSQQPCWPRLVQTGLGKPTRPVTVGLPDSSFYGETLRQQWLKTCLLSCLLKSTSLLIEASLSWPNSISQKLDLTHKALKVQHVICATHKHWVHNKDGGASYFFLFKMFKSKWCDTENGLHKKSFSWRWSHVHILPYLH